MERLMSEDLSKIPAVSVLVPIYNAESYLRESLDSLCRQTFTDFEVICINDGSTDASLSIIHEYKTLDSRFKIIDKTNSGYGASMNQGLARASGDYIAILEPDDYFEPDALEKLYFTARDKDLDVVKANYWFYWSADNRNVAIRSLKPHMTGHVLDPYRETEVFFVPPTIWSGIYKKSYLDENRIRFLETPGASFQDLSFTFKVWANTHRVWLLKDEIIHYRQDNEASSINDPKKTECIIGELAEINRAAKEIDARSSDCELHDLLMGIVFRMIYDNYLWNFQRLDMHSRKEFFKLMLAALKNGYEQGMYDPSMFHYYQQKNLEFILEEPERFLMDYPRKPTRIAKMKYYFKRGGFKAVKDIIMR